MYLIIAVTLVTLALTFYSYVTKNHKYWKSRGIPEAEGIHWLFGHSKDMIMGNIHFAHRFQKVYDAFPDSPFVGLLNFDSPYVMLRDPDDVKAVLSTDFNSFANNEFTVDAKNDFLMGHNPFVLTGQEWKMARGHATPLTTLAKLKHYLPNILKVGDEMVNLVKRKMDEKGLAEFETKAMSGMFTTDSVANAVFGVKNNTFEDENSFFAQVTKNIFTNNTMDTIKITIAFVFPKLANFIGYRLTSKHSEDVLLSLTRKVMSEREKTGENRNDIFQQMITYRQNDKTGEALRMYPPLSAFSKVCTSDYTFNSKIQLKVKKGIPVNIPVYALHMDEKYFPDPKKFDPERFTDEAIAKRHKFVYLPFGEGPRKCLGQRFGLLQVKVALMALVRNFRLIPSPKSKYPVEFDPQDFISKPLNGAWIQFESLNKSG